jgi:hypothetical protein
MAVGSFPRGTFRSGLFEKDWGVHWPMASLAKRIMEDRRLVVSR